MPNAMTTLRRCAMRNGHRRRIHPPVPGGARIGQRAVDGRRARRPVPASGHVVVPASRARRCSRSISIASPSAASPSRAASRRAAGTSSSSSASRACTAACAASSAVAAGRGHLELDAAAVAVDLAAAHPAAGLEAVEHAGERRPADRGLAGQMVRPLRRAGDQTRAPGTAAASCRSATARGSRDTIASVRTESAGSSAPPSDRVRSEPISLGYRIRSVRPPLDFGGRVVPAGRGRPRQPVISRQVQTAAPPKF